MNYTALRRDLDWMEQVTGTMTRCLPYTTEQGTSSMTERQHFLQRLFDYDTQDEQVTAYERYPDHDDYRKRVVYFENIIGDTLSDPHMKAANHIMSDVPIYTLVGSYDDDTRALLRTHDAVRSDDTIHSRDKRLVRELLLYSLEKSDQLFPTLIRMLQNLSQIPTVFSPYLCDVVYTGYGPENDFQWGVRSAFDVHVVRSAIRAFDRFGYRRDTPIAWQRDLFLTTFREELTDSEQFEQSMEHAVHHARLERV